MQPVPSAWLCQEMLQHCNMQENSSPKCSPSLSARVVPGEPLRILGGALIFLICSKRVLPPCMAATSGVGAHELCEPVAATL